MSLDSTDLKLVSILLKDGRKPLRKIAKELSLSTVTVSNRLKKLREEGIIKGFTAIVDWPELGYSLTVITEVDMKGKYFDDVGKVIMKHPNVCSVYNVSPVTLCLQRL